MLSPYRCIHICIYMYVCMYMYIYVCVCVYIYVCVCIYIYMCVYIYIYKHQKHQFSQFSRSVMSESLWSHESQHARPPCPSPTTGVYSNSCPLSQWCHPAISSSVHGISQARILQWVVISFSRGSSKPRNWTLVSCIDRQILYHWFATEAPAKNYPVQKVPFELYIDKFQNYVSRPKKNLKLASPFIHCPCSV